MAKYAHLTSAELSDKLRAKGLKISGTKRQKIARLAAHKRRRAGGRKLKRRARPKLRGPRKLKKTGHATPYAVRKARQTLRHSKSKTSKARAMATIRAYNRRQAKKSKHPKISVVHKGLLEVPAGRSVTSLPVSHFKKLAEKKGMRRIIGGLTNLQRWNENKNPRLSRWAKNMKVRLRKALKRS